MDVARSKSSSIKIYRICVQVVLESVCVSQYVSIAILSLTIILQC